jgi:O-antigen/teichoic acid export membrane protein
MPLGIIAKQSIYNAAYTYTGIGLGFITTIFLYPHILDPDQYGLTRVLISASMIGAQFAHLGIRNVVIRFFPLFRRTDKQREGFLFIALIVPLFGFIIFSLLFWIFRDQLIVVYAERSPLFVDFYVYVLPITLFLLYFEVLNSYLRSLRDSVTGSLISEVIIRIVVIIVLAVYFFGWITFPQFILCFTVAYGVQPLLMLAALLQKGELKVAPRLSLMRKSLARGMTSYGVYTLLGGLTTVIVWNIDIMMIGSFNGLGQTAVYAIAFYIGTVIAVPQRALERIATPLIAEHILQNNWKEVEVIYRKTSITQMITGIFILLLIWVNTEHLLSLLPDVYAEGRYVVLFIGLGKLFDMATGANGSIIITSKYYRFDLATNILLVIFTVGTNLLLIPQFGIHGAAVATMLSIFLYNLIKFIFVWIKFSMQPFTADYLGVIVLAIISFGIVSLLPDFKMIPNLVITTLIITLTFLCPIWWFEISDDLNAVVNRLYKQINDRS